jgi:hypothetical protein
MAGKLYTESGDKFQIPDMLANQKLDIILAISMAIPPTFELSLWKKCPDE